jgi:dTDP-4-amino-4,6-dideoxygalactose transaminase
MILVNEALFGGRENEYVMECLRTGWVYSEGRLILTFEERRADYCEMAVHEVLV